MTCTVCKQPLPTTNPGSIPEVPNATPVESFLWRICYRVYRCFAAVLWWMNTHLIPSRWRREPERVAPPLSPPDSPRTPPHTPPRGASTPLRPGGSPPPSLLLSPLPVPFSTPPAPLSQSLLDIVGTQKEALDLARQIASSTEHHRFTVQHGLKVFYWLMLQEAAREHFRFFPESQWNIFQVVQVIEFCKNKFPT